MQIFILFTTLAVSWIRNKFIFKIDFIQIMLSKFIEDSLLSFFRNISASLVDDKWHHACVSWGAKYRGLVQIVIDGLVKHDDFEDSVFDLSVRGISSFIR